MATDNEYQAFSKRADCSIYLYPGLRYLGVCSGGSAAFRRDHTHNLEHLLQARSDQPLTLIIDENRYQSILIDAN